MYGRRGPGLEPVWKSGPGDLDYNARSPDLAPKSHLSLKRWSAPELHVIKDLQARAGTRKIGMALVSADGGPIDTF